MKPADPLKKPRSFDPGNLILLSQLVELDLLESHFDAARQRIRGHFEKNPDAPAARFFEGKTLAAEGKWNATEAEAQKTLQVDPNFSSAYDLLRGDLCSCQQTSAGDQRTARAAFEESQ